VLKLLKPKVPSWLKENKSVKESSLYDGNGNAIVRNRCDVMIGMPTFRRHIEIGTYESLVELVSYSATRGIHVKICQPDSAVIAKSRSDIVDEARAAGAEYVFFIDSDMVFKPNYLEMLLAHKKDVVGGLCVSRVPPFYSTVYFLNKETELFVPVDSADPNAIVLNSLIRCDGTGTAFLLIKTSVFDKLTEPYFAMPPTSWMPIVEAVRKFDKGEIDADAVKASLKWEREGHSLTGEDLFFCKLLYNAGVELFVDTGTLIGHIGGFPFTYLDRLAYVEANNTTGKIAESGTGESENRIRSYAGAGVSSLLRATRKAEAVPSVSG
jgi:hypothetical protein